MRYLVITANFLLCLNAAAQEQKIPTWMLEAVTSEAPSTQLDRMDSIMDAHFGVDSISANRFIGTWSAVLTGISDGHYRTLEFDCWTDTTRAMLTLHIADVGNVIYLADLRLNTAVLATDSKGEQQAIVSTLSHMVLINEMMLASAMSGAAPVATSRKRTLLKRSCTEHVQVTEDTTRYWVSSITPSPFRDVANWLPMSGTYTIFGLLGAASERMTLRMEHPEVKWEVTTVSQGIRPRPPFDLSKYTVTDHRKGPTTYLPIRKGVAPVWSERGKLFSSMATHDAAPKAEMSVAPIPRVEMVDPDGGIMSTEADVFMEDIAQAVPEVAMEGAVYDHVAVEERPEYPGLEPAITAFIQKELRYPEMEKEAGIQGTVYLECVIDPTGAVTDVHVKRSVGGSPALDREAIRILRSMPKWKPGRHNGRPVAVRVIVPVKFRLDQ